MADKGLEKCVRRVAMSLLFVSNGSPLDRFIPTTALANFLAQNGHSNEKADDTLNFRPATWHDAVLAIAKSVMRSDLPILERRPGGIHEKN